MLHGVRSAVPGVLGERPAVLPRQLGEHAAQERGEPVPGLDPPQPQLHPSEQLVHRGLPSAGLYAVARGRRLIFRCPHN
jgi:hypothetical protein